MVLNQKVRGASRRGLRGIWGGGGIEGETSSAPFQPLMLKRNFDTVYYFFNLFSAGIDFRRQILTSKIDLRTVRVKGFIMAVDL